jgi:AbrB family looped-hinge helix DNA binding protein
MRLTSKGQMTVPKNVRDDMGIGPGSNVAFEKNDRGEFVLINLDARKKDCPGEQLVRHLQEIGAQARREGWQSGLTADEIMEMTRGPFDDVDHR